MRILRSVPLLAVMVAAPGLAVAQTGTNVGVTNTPTPEVADPGTAISFDLVVVSTGPDPAGQVVLDLQLAGLTFDSLSQMSGPTFDCQPPASDGDPIECTIDAMDVGATAEIIVVAKIPDDAPAGTFFTTIANVSTVEDINSEDDSSAGTVQATPAPGADLMVTETAPPGANQDTDITYTIVLDNLGPGDATNVVLSEEPPPGFPPDPPFVSLTQTSGPTFNCTSMQDSNSCTIASFPAGSQAVFQLVHHVDPGEGDGTTFTNVWNVSSDVDPNTENNGGVATVCVQADGCAAGPCNSFHAVVCTPAATCENQGTCDSNTSLCSANTPNTGNACDDGNACTQTDACVAGVCTGGNPVVCPTASQCEVQGTCNPSTGQCRENLFADDGTPCDDEDACTKGDTCQGGQCVATTVVTCPAAGPCAIQGTCNPAIGICSPNVPLADGTDCDDGDACTSGESCQAGVCAPVSTVTCPAAGPCETQGTCDPSTGVCAPNTPIPDCPPDGGGVVVTPDAPVAEEPDAPVTGAPDAPVVVVTPDAPVVADARPPADAGGASDARVADAGASADAHVSGADAGMTAMMSSSSGCGCRTTEEPFGSVGPIFLIALFVFVRFVRARRLRR